MASTITARIGIYEGKDGYGNIMCAKNCANKYFKTYRDYSITIKNPAGADLKSLEITIKGDEDFVSKATWVYISEYDRYYFIENRRRVRTGLTSLTLCEDVLTSRLSVVKSGIGQLMRSESNYNLNITDSRMPRPENAVVNTIKFPNTPFTASFPKVVVGVIGSANNQ